MNEEICIFDLSHILFINPAFSSFGRAQNEIRTLQHWKWLRWILGPNEDHLSFIAFTIFVLKYCLPNVIITSSFLPLEWRRLSYNSLGYMFGSNRFSLLARKRRPGGTDANSSWSHVVINIYVRYNENTTTKTKTQQQNIL